MRELMKQNSKAMRKMVTALTSTNASAIGATGALVSKLSTTRRTVLTACAGHDDNEDFVLPPLYTELEATSFTADAIHMTLRRLCIRVPGSQHKCNVHVTKKMVLTVRNGNYSSTNNTTFEGATSGVTPFGVPNLSPKVIHEEEMDCQAFEDATHKTQADNRKFSAGNKFIPAKDLNELIRVLNNYICWLEVMFGSQCPHLLLVVRLRDVLDENQDALEPLLDRHLRLSVLWKVHEDARQFFNKCEKWSHGEPLPQSRLRGMVDLLEYDQQVFRSLACPFDEFFNETKKGKGKGGGGGGGGGGANDGKDTTKKPQPTTNPTLLPLCVAAVNKVKAAYPAGMTIPKFCILCDMPTHKFTVGGRGGCSTYQVLGHCPAIACNYRHVACTVTDARQKEVAALLIEGLKIIADKKKPAASS